MKKLLIVTSMVVLACCLQYEQSGNDRTTDSKRKRTRSGN